MRTIRVVSPQFDGPKSIESDAKTWGELKSELSNQSPSIKTKDMSVVVKQGRNNLEEENANLPEGPFDIFMTAKKVKSGEDDFPTKTKLMKETVAALKKMATKEEVDFKSKDNKETLSKSLSKHFAKVKKNKNKATDSKKSKDKDPKPSKKSTASKAKSKTSETKIDEKEVVKAWDSLQEAIELLNGRNKHLAGLMGFDKTSLETDEEISDKELEKEYKDFKKSK